MVDKSELVAFEREKRLYKDAYVENFRSVRYFPSLATIGTGQSDGGSIVLVQEPPPAGDGAAERSRFNDVASRLISPDSQLDATLPLTMFRSAIMCKHTKARQARRAAECLSASKTSAAARHQTHSNTPGVFKPTSVAEAKGAIQRKVMYDGQPFQDKPRTVRSVTPRAEAHQTMWAINNPTNAREEICGRTFFNVPPEGPIKADRKYTQEFIRLSMEATYASHHHAPNDNAKGDLQNY